MATKNDLPDWVEQALKNSGARSTLTQVAKQLWAMHESELRMSGDLFFTWQYDMRWAANRLRRRGVMKSVALSAPGYWELTTDIPKI